MTKVKGFLVFVILIFVLTACGKKDEVKTLSEDVKDENQDVVPDEEVVDEQVEEDVVIIEEDDHEGQAINPLTGLYISEAAAKRRPFGIMINNLEAAMPQSGIAEADVMYETLVEGAICRLFGVFQEFDGEKIGPVRSARHYFLDFAFDHDAIYVHYGQSPQALNAFTALDAPNLNGLSYLDTIMCFQDPQRKRPHSTYTSYNGLMAGLESEGYRQERDTTIPNKFHFSDQEVIPTSGTANKVTLLFSYYSQPWFEYDGTTGLYKRFQYGVAQMDKETGKQLAYKNIIVQIADIWTIPGDTEGRLDMDLVSEGTGYYITNGAYMPITWKKASHYEPTCYYKEDGSVLEINPGKTWIAVFPSYRPDKIILE